MTAHETLDELWARLGVEHEPNRHLPNWETKVVCTCGERCSHWMDFYRHRGDAYRAAIDGMLACFTAAEADANRLAEQLRDTVEEFYGEDGYTYSPEETKCLRLHDEALALRKHNLTE